jgi:isoleucyl-tRNA synthetase
VDGSLVDAELGEQVALVRRLVELGRAARASAKVGTRQPLPRALVGAAGFDTLPDELRREVADELNVQLLEPLSAAGGDLVDVTWKGNFRVLGKQFGQRTPVVAAAIASGALRKADDGASYEVDVEGETLTVPSDAVLVTETPREGWAVARVGETVALDLTITPELRRLGLARDVVRLIQEARKASGLEVTDRIELWWESDDEQTRAALTEHADWVAGEVLATAFGEGRPAAEVVPHSDPELGLTFRLREAGR